MARMIIAASVGVLVMGAAPAPALTEVSLTQSHYLTREDCYRAHGCLRDPWSGTWLCPTAESWICEYYPPEGG